MSAPELRLKVDTAEMSARVKRNRRVLHGEHTVELEEMYPPDFMSQWAKRFRTIAELVENSPVDMSGDRSPEMLDASEGKLWEDYIADETRFGSWRQMVDQAALEWTFAQLQAENPHQPNGSSPASAGPSTQVKTAPPKPKDEDSSAPARMTGTPKTNRSSESDTDPLSPDPLRDRLPERWRDAYDSGDVTMGSSRSPWLFLERFTKKHKLPQDPTKWSDSDHLRFEDEYRRHRLPAFEPEWYPEGVPSRPDPTSRMVDFKDRTWVKTIHPKQEKKAVAIYWGRYSRPSPKAAPRTEGRDGELSYKLGTRGKVSSAEFRGVAVPPSMAQSYLDAPDTLVGHLLQYPGALLYELDIIDGYGNLKWKRWAELDHFVRATLRQRRIEYANATLRYDASQDPVEEAIERVEDGRADRQASLEAITASIDSCTLVLGALKAALSAALRVNAARAAAARSARQRIEYTGARELTNPRDLTPENARRIYDWIRDLDAEKNIATVARNTGMPERIIRAVRKHVFFDKHRLRDNEAGRFFVTRFTPDNYIAAWWKAASTGGIPKEELERVRLLISHEYIEHALMKSGLPYREFTIWGQDLQRGAHDLSLKIPNSAPGTELYPPGQSPWSHWDN